MRHGTSGAEPSGGIDVRYVAWRILIALSFVGLVAAIVAALYLPEDLYAYDVAQRLRQRGIPAAAPQVRIHVADPTRSGTRVDEVVVTYRTATAEEVTASLVGVYDDVDAEPGWQAPGQDSRYRAPLALVYLADRSATAMARVDLQTQWGTDPWRENGTVIAVGLGLTTAPGMVLLIQFMRQRRLNAQRDSRSIGRHAEQGRTPKGSADGSG
jgi:hypothetical protein